MKVYYNEFDKKKCSALQALMDDGHISKGDIDDRPIQEVMPHDLQGYTRCHFFAGIGLWDYALDLARWEEDRRVWTGSCPCQPFSSAGRQKGKGDDRHLWPEWMRLIRECNPPTLFGEQVNAAITHGWLDDVYQGLEAEGYAVGSAVLSASSVGAPHRRERLWFVANSGRITARPNSPRSSDRRKLSEEEGIRTEEGNQLRDNSVMGNTEYNGHSASEIRGSSEETVQHDKEGSDSTSKPKRASSSKQLPCESLGDSSGVKRRLSVRKEQEKDTKITRSSGSLGDTHGPRSQGHGRPREEYGTEGRETSQRHPWSSGVWVDCPDGKARLIEPSIPLLAHGYPERVGVIHSAGDAIVPQVAATFIKSFMEV